MSGAEHQATVERGLKMKIKRTTKNSGTASNKSDSTKHEIVKSGEKMSQGGDRSAPGSSSSSDFSQGSGSTNGISVEKSKHATGGDKDKSPKVKSIYKKDRIKDSKQSKMGESSTGLSSVSASLDAAFSQVSLETKHGETTQGKKDNLPDPYEFNAKVEDGIGFPVKKAKGEKDKNEESGTVCVSDQCVGTDYTSVATETNPDCLGPCEPGTSVVLDGIVWHETENGVLVVNVTWRGKTYVGTLLDTTKHDWAPPPRQSCESPVSDFETRTPKGRAKRGRASTTGTPVNEKVLEGRKLRKGRRGSSTFQAPPSPAKSDVATPTAGLKRKGRPPDIDISVEKANKRSRSCSRGTPGAESPVPNLIECPEPNCGKKYRHVNGLRYHQSHAHSSQGVDGDDDTRDVCLDNEDSLMDDLDSNVDDLPSDVNSSAANNATASIENMDEESNLSVKKSDEEQKDVASSKTESGLSEESNSANSTKNNTSSTKSDAGVTNGPQQKKDTSTSVFVSSETSVNPLPMVTVAATPLQIVSTNSVSPNFSNVVSQAKSLTMGLATPLTANIVTATPMQSAIPITVTATTAQIFDQSKPAIRPKTMANRPIMPSNMITLSTSVSVTHTNLSPVTTTHMQTSTSQLKPIQPKPTVMGETPVVNPVLLGLNRDKKLKAKKKSKDKEPSGHTVTSTLASPTSHIATFSSSVVKTPIKLDGGKHEPQGVIKVAPIVAKPVETSKSESLSQPKIDLEQKHMGANVGVIAAQVQPMKGIDLSSGRSSEGQPSVLKVTPSLHVSSSDNNKTNINDDVQSPAYSDISDANESSSPAPPPPSESPKSKLDDLPLSNKRKETSSSHGDTQSSYGLYGQYYNQQNYMLPNMSTAAHSPSGANSNSQKLMGTGKDRNSVGPEANKQVDRLLKIKQEESKEEKKDGTVAKSDGARPYSQAEYLQHQKWVQQQMFYLQTLPHHAQYQYMTAYGSYMDPAYHMHMMNSDPHYRQHFEKNMEEQRRVLEGTSSRSETDTSNKPLQKSSSMEMVSGQRSSSTGPSDSNQGNQSKPGLDSSFNRDLEHKKNDMSGNLTKEEKERNARDKQNENHLIMKENLDIKAQMDKNRMEQQSQQHLDMYRSQSSRMTDEQHKRLLMYKQQKYIEQQKREEQQQQQRMTDSTNNKQVDKKTDISGKSQSGGLASDRKEIKEEIRSDLVRRESDIKPKQSSEMDFKSANDEKHRSQSVERQRNIETPKSKVGLMNKSSSPLTPSSSMSSSAHSPAMGVGSSYSPYMYHNQYIQSPPYGHMQIDPSHPMYRGMNPAVMYTGAYLHPSQLGYRVGGMEDSLEKEKLSASQKGPGESEVKVSDPAHVPIYHSSSSSGHKIHELQEKGRPSPHRASPVTVKGDLAPSLPVSKSVSSNLEKGREFSNSPPTQRHVHTHHHTHVLEAAYPVYPYTGIIPPGAGPQPPQTPPTAPLPHSTFPSSK